MVSPLLSILFDLLLVGSAIAIVAAMLQEYFDSRTPSIGGKRAAGSASVEPRSQPGQSSRIRRERLKRVA